QCPMLAAAEGANPKVVAVRFLDREAHLDIAERFRICGGLRVPTAIFMNEEFDFVSVMGDKTLSRLRAVAARKLGPACPLPGAPARRGDEPSEATNSFCGGSEPCRPMLCAGPEPWFFTVIL